MLGHKSKKVSPLFWKSKQILKVCHSAKEAETRNIMSLVDTAAYFAEQLKVLLFGDTEGKIPVKVYSDSKPLLESIASSKQVEQRLLRNTMTDLKEKLASGVISSYSWVDTKSMVADVLTKESGDTEKVLEIVRENVLEIAHSKKCLVVYEDGEIAISGKDFDHKEDSDQTRVAGEC